MKPVLLPLAEHVGRFALRRRGILSHLANTPLGPVHTYDAAGTGSLPTTIVLHGLGSAATPFAPLLAHLQRDVKRIVAPDYPGHGFSKHPGDPLTPTRLFEAVATILDNRVQDPAVVIGNSLGGALALQYALTRPERVRALVLVSPAGAPSTEEEWRYLRSVFAITNRSEARAFVERIYHRPPWFLPLLAHEFPKTLNRRAVRELLANASNESTPEPEALASLKMPILFVWGRSERLLPRTHLEYFTRHLPPHAIVEEPDGFGHCPHFDAPGRLAKRIVAFARASLSAT